MTENEIKKFKREFDIKKFNDLLNKKVNKFDGYNIELNCKFSETCLQILEGDKLIANIGLGIMFTDSAIKSIEYSYLCHVCSSDAFCIYINKKYFTKIISDYLRNQGIDDRLISYEVINGSLNIYYNNRFIKSIITVTFRINSSDSDEFKILKNYLPEIIQRTDLEYCDYLKFCNKYRNNRFIDIPRFGELNYEGEIYIIEKGPQRREFPIKSYTDFETVDKLIESFEFIDSKMTK